MASRHDGTINVAHPAAPTMLARERISGGWRPADRTGPAGYVERSYTTGTALASAAIRNRAGTYTTPTTAAITAAATPGDISIVNQPAPAAYPISGYS